MGLVFFFFDRSFFFVVGQSSECFVRWMKFVSLFSVSLSSV